MPRVGDILVTEGKAGRQEVEVAATDLSQIPVLVFTTSDLAQDMVHCYEHGSATFITKPMTMADFVGVLTCWTEYWFQVVAPDSAQ